MLLKSKFYSNKVQPVCLLTGAGGFIGSCLHKRAFGIFPKIIPVYHHGKNIDGYIVDINNRSDWSEILKNVDVVIHTAAVTYNGSDAKNDKVKQLQRVNVDGTLNLAKQAALSKVKRFIFISSVKVNGEGTLLNQTFDESKRYTPLEPYGISKYEAEEGLKKIAKDTGIDVVIIRPPLVYGSGVKANFLNLLKLANTNHPLPFGSIHNKRSMIYIENLVDFIIHCIDHPAAANETFLISDGEDISLSHLLKSMRSAFGRPARLVPVPPFIFRLLGKLTRKTDVVNRLIGNLQIDSSKARDLLGWEPPYTVEQGIKATVSAYSKSVK